MPRQSEIANHPQRQKIIDAILAGQPYRDITAWTVPPVGRGVLSRFKASSFGAIRAKVREAQASLSIYDSGPRDSVPQSVTRAAMAAVSDPFMLRVLNQDKRRASWMDDLEQAPEASDYRTLAQLDRNDLVAQEYLAKLAGRLDNTASQVNVTIVQAQPSQAPAPDDVLTIDITQK